MSQSVFIVGKLQSGFQVKINQNNGIIHNNTPQKDRSQQGVEVQG